MNSASQVEKSVQALESRRRLATGLVWAAMGLAAAAYAAAVGWLSFHRGAPLLIAALSILFCGTLGGLSVLGHRVRSMGRKAKAMPASVKRYMAWFLPAMALYGVALTFSTQAYNEFHPAGLVVVLLALAPSLPVLVAIAAIGRFLTEMEDEFARLLMTRSYVLATGLTLAICTIWGFLETFGVVFHIPAWAVFPLLAICLWPAMGITWWRYR